jgi:nucleotidyltransferase/DNA polymerase involved in DNA repair
MNSRAKWLNYTRDLLKQDIPKKKYFKVHKNLHNFDFSPKSLSPLNKKTDSTPDMHNPSLIPLHQLKTIETSKNLNRILKEKDSEISNLKQLYEEANSRLKKVENERFIQGNLDFLQISPKKSVLPDLSPSPKLDSLKVSRNKSTLNYRPEVFSDFPHLNQTRFTKNRPKLILGNPITGIPLISPK